MSDCVQRAARLQTGRSKDFPSDCSGFPDVNRSLRGVAFSFCPIKPPWKNIWVKTSPNNPRRFPGETEANLERVSVSQDVGLNVIPRSEETTGQERFRKLRQNEQKLKPQNRNVSPVERKSLKTQKCLPNVCGCWFKETTI